MAANPKDPRTQRRKAAGDDPNKTMMAPQPLPGMPQDNKGGNSMNYPMMQSPGGEIGQQMGNGPYQFPYGDLGQGLGPAVTPIGFTNNSGQPQNLVPGQGYNRMPYNAIPVPDAKQMEMMEPMYDMASAMGQTMPNGLNNGQPVSYGISALGPTGKSAPDPAEFPPTMPEQSSGTMPLQGVPSAEAVTGMSTGRGGGRNKGKK